VSSMAGAGESIDDPVPMTFLFTDIEGSTRLWERYPTAMPDIIRRHDELIDGAVADRGVVRLL